MPAFQQNAIFEGFNDGLSVILTCV